jgi:hypothetical protein
MEKQEKNHSVKLSTVVCFILFILFCASPCSALFVTSGETVNIDYGVDYLIVMGTVNLYPDAYAYQGIMALSGGKINFHGGQLGTGRYISAFGSSSVPEITVYGGNFAVNGQPCDPLATSFMLVPGVYKVLTGFYENGDPINLTFYGNIPINLVAVGSKMVIDIKPGNEQNNINLNSNGVVPVAVLTTDDFDAATVNPATALFAGAAPEHWSVEDVDADGDDDVIFHFRTQQLNLNEDSTEATLTAQLAGAPLASEMTILSAVQTSGGTVVSGTDAVKIVASKKSKK